MDGELLVAPVLREDSEKDVYLPSGIWHHFRSSNGSTPVVRGPITLTGSAKLEEIPVFVVAGTIVTLASLVQYTDALPDGPLEVRIYGGADATFKLFQDDGATFAY